MRCIPQTGWLLNSPMLNNKKQLHKAVPHRILFLLKFRAEFQRDYVLWSENMQGRNSGSQDTYIYNM